MRVLTVNPGSSSAKLSVVEDSREVDRVTVGAASAAQARRPLAGLVVRRHPIDAAGVRFVHGGLSTDPVPLDHAETARLTALTPLAPLHQPLSLGLAAVVAEIVPGPVYACFDTAAASTRACCCTCCAPVSPTRPALDDALDRGSGLAGMTGTGGDARDVLAARDRGEPDARTAIEVHLHRLRREIGAMVASLDRLDALVFTGGVAEHQPALLAELCERWPSTATPC